MTTISSKRRKSKVNLRTLVPAGVILFVVVLMGVLRGDTSRIFWFVAEPILGARSGLQKSEVTQLKAELTTLKTSLADRNVLYSENLDLKRRLGRDAGIKTTLAAVIMRPPGVPYDILIIDAGSKEGVEKGDLVSAGGTTLIGTISNVYDSTSRVLLFSAPGEFYQGLISAKIPISVEGQGGGSLRGQVPAGTKLKIGDPVLLPSMLGGFASKISHIESLEGSSFQTVYMHLPVNLFEVYYVEIWKRQLKDKNE